MHAASVCDFDAPDQERLSYIHAVLVYNFM